MEFGNVENLQQDQIVSFTINQLSIIINIW